MAFRVSVELQNKLINDMLTSLASAAGSGGKGRLRIYTGTQPATPLTSPSGTLLVEISNICWGAAFTEVASHSVTIDVDNGSSKGTITASTGTPYSLIPSGAQIIMTGTTDNNGTYIVDSVAGGNVITTTTVITGADGVEATTVLSPNTAQTAVLLNALGYGGTASATGTAGWARLEDSTGTSTYIIDGDVGLTDYNVFKINTTSIVSTETITLLSANIYLL